MKDYKDYKGWVVGFCIGIIITIFITDDVKMLILLIQLVFCC